MLSRPGEVALQGDVDRRAGTVVLLTGIPRTEPARAAVTQTLEPLCTVILAVTVLGEQR